MLATQVRNLALAGAALLTACASDQRSPAPRPAPVAAAVLPAKPVKPAVEAPTKALFESTCGGCHDLATTTGQRKTHAEWASTVDRMVTRGAPLSEPQAAEITDYLARHYGAG